MARTAIADIIDPEVLADQISAKFPDNLVIAQTDIVEVDGTFPLGSPGTKFKIPFWKRVGAFADLTEGVAMTPGKASALAEHATVVRGGAAYEVLDTAVLVTKADPVGEISSQIARRAAEYIDAKLVLEVEKSPNTFDQATVQVDSVATMTQNAVIRAMTNTLGDNYGQLVSGAGAIIMHSKVYGDLLQRGDLQNAFATGLNIIQTGLIPTLLGMPVIISDRVSAVTVSSVTTYQTYVVGRGSLGLFFQRRADVEFDRDILMLSDVISANVHFAPHLFGYDDDTTAVVSEDNKSIWAVNIASL